MKPRIIVLCVAVSLTILLGGAILLHAPQVQARAAEPEQQQPAALAALPVIDDFESGLPAAWFSYGDYGSGTAIATNVVATATVPGAAAGNHALQIAYTSAGWGAGTGKNLGGQDWHFYDGLAFWFRGTNSGGVYRVILSDNPNPAVPGDSAERFAYEFKDNATGWRYVTIPWGAFFRDPTYQPGGAPNDGLTLTEVQAYALALPSGTRTAYLDDVRLVKFQNVDDFESGMPAGWFSYGDYGGGTAIATNVVATATVPGAAAGNHALEIAYTSAGWGAGTGKNLPGPDWSHASGFSFWFRGTNSGGTYRVILSDNPNPAVPGDSAERFAYEFNDNATGWRYVAIPWAAFFRDPTYQPGGAPDDGLTLTQVQAYALALPSGTRTAHLDHVALFGEGQAPLTVAFDRHDYAVKEGGTATITATLNMAAAAPVTVTYTTADGTAKAGTDYVAAAGQLVFPPGATTRSFTVSTIDNKVIGPGLTVSLVLTNPVGAALGSPNRATLSIANVDQPSPYGKVVLVDDFESGLPAGKDANNVGVGFVTWAGGGSTVAITTTAAPAPVPGVADPNHVLKLDANVTNWGGFTHAFTNAAANQWLSQDWSSYVGLSLWVYGNNSNTDLFVDLLENRNPGATTDDAERWSYAFKDDFSGWKLISIPFGSFGRKDIGNGAPNDGLTLREVHGWAFGTLNTGGPKAYYLDNVGLMVRTTVVDDFESGLPAGKDTNNIGVGFVTWAGGGSTVAITTTVPPAPVPGGADPNHVLKLDANVTNWGGFTHAFTNAAANQWLSQDWSSYEGIELWVYGNNSNTDLFVDLLENRNPGATTDDAERWSYAFKDDFSGWKLIDMPFGSFGRKDIGNGAPNDGLTLREVHGWAFGTLNTGGPRAYYLDNVTIYGNKPIARPVEAQFELARYTVGEGASQAMNVTLSVAPTRTVTVKYATTDGTARPIRDFVPVSGTLTFAPSVTTQSVTLQTIDDGKYAPDKILFLTLSDPVNAVLGGRKEVQITIAESTPYDPALLDDFETGAYLWKTWGNVTLSTPEIKSGDALAVPGQGAYEKVLKANYGPAATRASAGGTGFGHPFAQGQDWRSYNGLALWYHGQNTSKAVTVEMQDNRAPDPGPAGWQLVWSDEFNDPAGTPPNPKTWTRQVGDGKLSVTRAGATASWSITPTAPTTQRLTVRATW